MSLIIYLLLVVSLLAQYPEADRVSFKIPGYGNYPYFSGYLNITKEKAFHYVFFTSQHDTTNDPVLLWLNGGPGCSSLIGMVTQNGPFIFEENSTQFKINKYSWNNKANLLYIQSPAHVGFSIGPAASSDDSVKADNVNAVLAFFEKFPSLRKNEFYLSGQSYAGIYVPYLALGIHEHNIDPKSKSQINFKGFMIGNACTDPWECYYPGNGMSMFQYEFLYKHMYYNDEQYNKLTKACNQGYFSDQCVANRYILDTQFDKTNTEINNIYAPCYYQSTTRTRKFLQSGRIKQIIGGVDCSDAIGAVTFWNNQTIRGFFHVAGIGSRHLWDFCDPTVEDNYVSNANASYWIYPILMNAGYRLWVYSGDVDANVPITGTVGWVNKLRLENSLPIVESWRPWAVPGRHDGEAQVGGTVWRLQNLTFVSIRDAGHMVPRDQPQSAQVMLTAFLTNSRLPTTD